MLTGEVQQHLGGGRVRCVALGSAPTVLVRGMRMRLTRAAPFRCLSVKGTLGRVFNVCWAIRSMERGDVSADEKWPIHREPLPLRTCPTKTELFETGIKVVDLLTPFVRGGKAGLFGGAGLGKTVILTELIARIASAARWLLGVCRCRRTDT